MKTEAEIQGAIAILGASFAQGEMRRFVWGGLEQEGGRAWAMFQALGWVAGADGTDFGTTLEYVALRMEQFLAERKETERHA